MDALTVQVHQRCDHNLGRESDYQKMGLEMQKTLWASIVLLTLFFAGAASAQQLPENDAESLTVAQAGRNRANPVVQVAPNSVRDELVDKLNSNTVTVVSGNPNGTYLFFAYDLSAVLDEGDDMRVLPVIGKGGAQNVKDVLYLRGVDMGITQSNVLRYFNETGEVGRNISDRLRYITRLYNEEMHVLVRANINSLEELKGRKVNFSDIGSGTQTTSRLVFKDLKIPVQEVNMGQADAFEAMKRGELDATILIAGKPAGSFSKLKPDPAYKLLPIPYSDVLQEYYLPAQLSNEDYPLLIPQDKPVNTIAVSSVLAVFNWPSNTERYRRVAKFTETFFKNYDKFLRKPRHPKWKEVNLAAELPGWKRFTAAQEILDREKGSNTELKQSFDQFINKIAPEEASSISPKRREELFAKFLEWQEAQKAKQ